MPLTQPTATAIAYARSLLELAQQQNQAEPIGQELAALRDILQKDPAMARFFADPVVGKDARATALDHALRGKISPLLFNFIGVLNQNNRLGRFDEIASAYADLLDEHLGHVEVDLTVARRLSADELDRVRQRLATALRRQPVLHQYVDESIIGGMVLRVQDRLIDASVRYQLQAMKDRLIAAAPR